MTSVRNGNRSRQRLSQAYQVTVASLAMVALTVVIAMTPIYCGVPTPDLPFMASAPILRDSETTIRIWIRKDATYVGWTAVATDQIDEALREIAADGASIAIFADRDTEYASVVAIMREARDAGVTDASLVSFSGGALDAWERGAKI